MSIYVDSSVLLRIVLAEPDPLREWPEIAPIASEIIRVESLRAVERLRHMGAFDDDEVAQRREGLLDTLARFRLVATAGSVLDRACDPFPVYVATLDAVHLATAIELRNENPDLGFATHDTKLAAAARSVGFDVLGA